MERRGIVNHREVIAIGVLALGLLGCQGGTPAATASATGNSSSGTPDPATAPPATEAPGPLAAALQYQWIHDPTAVPGLVPAPNVASLKVTASSVGFYANVRADQNPTPILNSAAGVKTDGTVRLVLGRDEAGCHAGDEGTYELTASVSGLALVVRPLEDTCAVRKAAIAGEWTRASCPSAPQWCLGDMDPGPHVSINYLPFVKAPDWDFDYGRFAFTVPEGWRTQEDSADGYVLIQRDGADGSGIFVFSDVLAHARSKECTAKPATGVGSSAAAIDAWIRSRPGIKVTNAKDVTVGGLRGSQIDIDVDPASAGRCPWTGDDPTVQLFVNAESARTKKASTGGSAAMGGCGCSSSTKALIEPWSWTSRRWRTRPGRPCCRPRCRSSNRSTSATDRSRAVREERKNTISRE